MRLATKKALVAPVLLMMVAAVGCNRTQERPPESTATAPATSPQAGERSDSQLATAVQARYYNDDTVRGRQIDVSAQNGVVTLRGSVESEAVKQQAVNLARNVEGVTSVNDEIEVRETTTARTEPADQQQPPATGTTGRTPEEGQPGWITTKIQSQYFTNTDIKPWNIDVSTASGGVVTLEGAVDSEQAKNEAVRIARETEGVTRVEDRLRVQAEARERAGREAAAPTQPDPWVTAKIQAKYFVDDEVKARDIDVDTREGVVTLKGTVASEAERRQAVAIARNTDGVRNVTDELRVDRSVAEGDRADTAAERGPTTRERRDREPLPAVTQIDRPDPWITMKIQSKYFLDAEVKGRQIDVDTRNGVVTLKGQVDNEQQKKEAEQIARETEGVKRVNNQLTVGASGA